MSLLMRLVRMHCSGMHLPGAGLAMQHDARRPVTAIQLEARTVVVQIDQRATPGLGDALEGALEQFAAVARGGAEDIAGKTVGVHADERRGVDRVLSDLATDQREMALAAIHLALVSDHGEVAILRMKRRFGDAVDVAL